LIHLRFLDLCVVLHTVLSITCISFPFTQQIKKWINFYVDKTTIDWDVDFFSRFLEHDPDTDPGMGVFQNCDGRYDIPVIGENIISIHKNTLHPLQKRYHMESGYDEDFVICPTLKSIRTRNIPLPFRVNHHQFHPTHKLTWIDHALDYPHSHYILKSMTHVKSGREVCFKYKL